MHTATLCVESARGLAPDTERSWGQARASDGCALPQAISMGFQKQERRDSVEPQPTYAVWMTPDRIYQEWPWGYSRWMALNGGRQEREQGEI